MKSLCFIKSDFKNYLNKLLNNKFTCERKRIIRESINSYLKIQELFKNNDSSYRELFCVYYDLNFHQQMPNIVEKYFGLMDAERNNTDSSEIYQKVEHLFKLMRKRKDQKEQQVYHVYSTKLVHTIDNNFPIIDKHIKGFLGIDHRITIATIKSIQKIYIKLQNSFKNEIRCFRRIYCCESISTTKCIDFIVFLGDKLF